MRPTLSLKTLLRTPFKTAITFLLVAAASFALFSRVADYAVSAREMSKVKDSYHGVITLDNGIPNMTLWDYHLSDLPKTRTITAWGIYYQSLVKPTPLTVEQMNAFASIPGVTAETRYMTGGVINEFERLNPKVSEGYDWGYDYGARFVMEGTYEGNSDYKEMIAPTSTDFSNSFPLYFSDIKQYAGRVQAKDGETAAIDIAVLTPVSEMQAERGDRALPVVYKIGNDPVYVGYAYNDYYDSLNSSTYYFGVNQYVAIFDIIDNKFTWTYSFADTLVPGERYIFTGRYVPNTFDPDFYYFKAEEFLEKIELDIKNGYLIDTSVSEEMKEAVMNGEITVMPIEEMLEYVKGVASEEYISRITDYVAGKYPMILGDFDTIDYVPSVLKADDTENIAKMMEIVDITNQDAHTFDIVYTDNMAAIPRFNDKKMTITSGRAITSEDKTACVISQYLADAYGLKLGDKLNIGLGDKLFEQYAQLGAVTYIPERKWNVAKTSELEIVGVYKDIDSENERNSDMFMGYSPNTIFVPMSQLPVPIPDDHEVKPGEYSLFIPNADDYAAVMEKAEPLAAEMGLTLRASDGGYESVKSGISDNSKVSVLTASLYIFSAMLALTLAVYLYIWRSKKAYAIMRALGTPVKTARNSLILPLAVLVVFAMLVGGVIGIIYTSGEMKNVLQGFETIGGSYVADASVPVFAVIIALICEVGFIALFTLLFLHKLAKTPPLSLLQGVTVDRRKRKMIDIITADDPPVIGAFKVRELPLQRGYSAFRHVTNYIFKHMKRAGVKTAISLTLAVVLTGAIGVITLTKSNYENMFGQVEVKSSINNVTYNNIVKLSQSDLVRNIYIYGNYAVSVNGNFGEVYLTMTNDFSRYLTDSRQDNFTVEYADGYSESLFTSDISSGNNVCVLNNKAADRFGVNLGDNLLLLNYDTLKFYDTFGKGEDYRKTVAAIHTGEYETDEELDILVQQQIEADIKQASVPYKVAGIANFTDPFIPAAVYTPLGKSAQILHSASDSEDITARLTVNFAETILSDNNRLNEMNAALENAVIDSLGVAGGEPSFHTDTTELDNIRRVRDLLATLFPIAVTAAVLIGATAPLLIIIQSAKEAAIMRILGTTKKRTRCILAFEQIILCAVGLACAAGGLVVYNAGLFAESTPLLAVCGVLYLLGGAAAALGAAVSVTSRKVLELLQVKE